MSTEVLRELESQEAEAWREVKLSEARVTIARGKWEILNGKVELHKLIAEDSQPKDEK